MKAALNKQVLGLPLYAWLAGAASFLFVVVYFIRQRSSGTASGVTPANATTSSQGPYFEYIPYPYPSSQVSSGTTPAPSPPTGGGSAPTCPPGYFKDRFTGRCMPIPGAFGMPVGAQQPGGVIGTTPGEILPVYGGGYTSGGFVNNTGAVNVVGTTTAAQPTPTYAPSATSPPALAMR